MQTDTQSCLMQFNTHDCVFPVLYTDDKDLKSEKAKDKSHNGRCMLLLMYMDTCSKEGGGHSF